MLTVFIICLLIFSLVLAAVFYAFLNNHFQKRISLDRDGVYIERVKDRQFNVYLTRENFQNLEKLREATGKKTLEETLRCALDWVKKHEGE